MDTTPAPKVEYGVTPTDVMASMSGLDFVRAILKADCPRRRSCRMSSRSIPPPSRAS